MPSTLTSLTNSPPPTDDRDIEVLNLEYGVPELEGHYRLRIGKAVKYLTVQSGVYSDEDTMSFARLFIRSLPDLPEEPWTSLDMSRDHNGKLFLNPSNDPLPSAEPWHPNMLDVLSLPRTRTIGSKVYETLFEGQPAIAKIARFPWEMPLMNLETMVYSDIAAIEKEEGSLSLITPSFLGHLVENGRVMGFLLDRIEGSYATIEDLPVCRDVLQKLHDMKIIHGDVNRYNFIVSKDGTRSFLLDFEDAEQFSEERAREEMASLEKEFEDESGRGKKSQACT